MGLYTKAEDLMAEGETVALVTVTSVEGSAPRDPGTTMLVREDGSIEGTIGGGTVEELSRCAAMEAIKEREPNSETWELRPDGNTGMVCDGQMEVFINVLEGKRRLIIAGGGHIAVPVVQIAADLGYESIVIDDREEFADSERFPQADVIHAKMREGFDKVNITSNTAVIIATRSGTLDRRAAERALQSEAFYVGCVASGSKAEHIRSGLREDGFDEEAMVQFRAPVGLNLGADSPAEIALSIHAEIQRDLYDASGERLTNVDPDKLIVVRGGGDVASGVIYRLHEAGYPVIVTEIEEPTVQRLEVAFATAMFDDTVEVEEVTARRADDITEAISTLRENEIPVLEDPKATVTDELNPAGLVDAIMAKGKHDTGTRRDDADVVIGLGPGFEAGADVDAAIETNRGPDLGRIHYNGSTSPYDGIPSEFEGFTKERLFRAPTSGTWETAVEIGDTVEKGITLGTVNGEQVTAEMDGLVRGLAYDGLEVEEGLKLGDLDPRVNVDPTKIADKALNIGGSVITAFLKLS